MQPATSVQTPLCNDLPIGVARQGCHEIGKKYLILEVPGMAVILAAIILIKVRPAIDVDGLVRVFAGQSTPTGTRRNAGTFDCMIRFWLTIAGHFEKARWPGLGAEVPAADIAYGYEIVGHVTRRPAGTYRIPVTRSCHTTIRPASHS